MDADVRGTGTGAAVEDNTTKRKIRFVSFCEDEAFSTSAALRRFTRDVNTREKTLVRIDSASRT